jgi:succinate dehydrogenase/fumarate reductase flavoprotein subunit
VGLGRLDPLRHAVVERRVIERARADGRVEAGDRVLECCRVEPERAQMLMADGKPSANMFAAGEIMAGSILGKGYLAGFGMTIGTVFGRIAGEEAARNART